MIYRIRMRSWLLVHALNALAIVVLGSALSAQLADQQQRAGLVQTEQSTSGEGLAPATPAVTPTRRSPRTVAVAERAGPGSPTPGSHPDPVPAAAARAATADDPEPDPTPDPEPAPKPDPESGTAPCETANPPTYCRDLPSAPAPGPAPQDPPSADDPPAGDTAQDPAEQ